MRAVDIVLATYRPNMSYLKKLLLSLNNQTYASIKLIVRDDSDDEKSFIEISNLVNKIITAFSFQIFRNDNNIGSNKTFEKLTMDANSDYIAYCDQDDVWESSKIEKLVKILEEENALLCYSDLSIIDKNDMLIANSFKDILKRLEHLKGDGLFEYFLRRNSVTGCSMLIKSEVAKDAIPFCNEYYIHDHWLTLYASSIGKIAYIQEPLIMYRIHGENQIGATILNDIQSRNDYYSKKLLKERKKYHYLLNNYKFNKNCIYAINRTLNWTDDRINFFENRNLKNFLSMVKKIKDDPQLILLEIALNLLPDIVGCMIIKKVKQ